ncbi:sensor histidine kinase [Streptomyces uncialis]|uniref:sensor histidine kinase n=1 Tax=Streptomyces uncialis TaxID=1048205 RepID=UPI0037AD6CD8
MSTAPPPPGPPGRTSPRTFAHRARTTARDALRDVGVALVTPTGSTEALLSQASRSWMRMIPYVVALALVSSLLPTTIGVLIRDYEVAGALAGALAVAQTAPLLLAVTRPLPAWWIIGSANVLCAVTTLDATADRPAPWLPPAIVGYAALSLALALREKRRTLVAVWLTTTVASLLLAALSAPGSRDTSVLMIVLSGAMLLVGTLIKDRREAQHKLAEQEDINEAERSHRALLEERARIARELHDVVAHHMSVITVQADSAPYRLGNLPPGVVKEFESIATGARESLGEMRRLLSVLRSEDTAGERAPQPGLDRLRHLADATVRAGVPVVLSSPEIALVRELAQLSPAVDLSAYRIVQEALANVVRHAPGALTEVLVSTDRKHLTVAVVNRPSKRPSSAPLEHGSTGHGLIGMAERVRLVGGTLDVGPLPDGGFRVAARMPVVEPGGTAPAPDRPPTVGPTSTKEQPRP